MDNAKMMADALKFRKAIEAEVVEVEENGVKITIGGDLKIKKLSFDNSDPDVLKDAVNKAIRAAQEMTVLKMKETMMS